jgi:hypothetical protein
MRRGASGARLALVSRGACGVFRCETVPDRGHGHVGNLHGERARHPVMVRRPGWGRSRVPGAHATGYKKTPSSPSTGDERCWPVVPPLFAAFLRYATFAARRDDVAGHCGVAHRAMHRPCNGSRLSRNPGYPSPPTAHVTCGSGRSSRVLFAGIPDPASQLSRFSASTLPGTRPCRRQCDLGCCCAQYVSVWGNVKRRLPRRGKPALTRQRRGSARALRRDPAVLLDDRVDLLRQDGVTGQGILVCQDSLLDRLAQQHRLGNAERLV